MKKITAFFITLIFFLFIINMFSCKTENKQDNAPTVKFLNTFENELNKQKNANVFSVSIYQQDALQTRYFGKNNPCQNAYSIAKVYIVTAIGLLVDQNLLSIDELLVDILADELPETYNDAWNNTTVEMLILHNVGLEERFLDIDAHDSTNFGEDYLKYILTAPIREDFSFQTYSYTDASYYLLSRIIEKKCGMGTDNFLWKHLFYPLNCKEVAWSHCPKGHVIGATGLYIRSEDLVKLGLVYLNGGMYKNTRILSQNWVQKVLDNGYELKSHDNGITFSKRGMNGQMLIIVPSLNRVIAWLGYGHNNFESLATK